MAYCTYDNPATMCRECWADGALLCHYAMVLLLSKPPDGETQPMPGEYFFFGANIGPWKEGQIIGDPDALLKPRKEETK